MQIKLKQWPDGRTVKMADPVAKALVEAGLAEAAKTSARKPAPPVPKAKRKSS